MIIDWYVKANTYSPSVVGTKVSDKFLSKVVETATPLMDYFCVRLTEMLEGGLEINQVETVFGEIVEELPVMNYRIKNEYGVDQFIIQYNKFIEIRLTDSTKQIYREIKLTKILS